MKEQQAQASAYLPCISPASPPHLPQVMEQQAQASGHGWGAQETQAYLSG